MSTTTLEGLVPHARGILAGCALCSVSAWAELRLPQERLDKIVRSGVCRDAARPLAPSRSLHLRVQAIEGAVHAELPRNVVTGRGAMLPQLVGAFTTTVSDDGRAPRRADSPILLGPEEGL